MKARTFFILNISAGSLLLVALYLNFAHKDPNPIRIVSTHKAMAANGTIQEENTVTYLQREKKPSLHEKTTSWQDKEHIR